MMAAENETESCILLNLYELIFAHSELPSAPRACQVPPSMRLCHPTRRDAATVRVQTASLAIYGHANHSYSFELPLTRKNGETAMDIYMKRSISSTFYWIFYPSNWK